MQTHVEGQIVDQMSKADVITMLSFEENKRRQVDENIRLLYQRLISLNVDAAWQRGVDSVRSGILGDNQ